MDKLSFPNRITVELTNQCNVSCTFCPRQVVPMAIGYMDITLFHKIIDEAALHLPVKLVIFFRGESLLHPDFLDCVRYAKMKGIGPIQYATNAYGLSQNITDQLLDSEIDFISFSLDTLDPEIYRKSRLSGDLSISIENVIYMSRKCAERKKRGMKVPTLQVSTIELPDYLDGQEDFINFWRNYVDQIRVYYEHDDKGGFRDPEIRRELEILVPDRKPCRKVFTDMLIFWDGQLALCNYDWRGGLTGLNVKEMSLQEAWDSDEYEKCRKMHLDGSFDTDSMCKGCGHWKIDYMPEGYLGRSYKGEYS